MSFGYRSDGLRACRQRTLSGSTEKRYYLYDQGNAVKEFDANGNVKAVNVFDLDGLASRHWGTSSHHYYVFDWQVNVSQSLYSGTSIRRNYAYNAWGAVNYTTPDYYVDSDWDQVWQYNARWGYQRDTVAGLYYCQQRYYDSSNGRWVTRDPIGYMGGVNVYGYCAEAPLQRIDPIGFKWWSPYKWAFTGDGYASDEVYEAALVAGLDAYDCMSECLAEVNRMVMGYILGGAAGALAAPIPKCWIPENISRGLVGGAGASEYTSAARVLSLMLRSRGIDASAMKAIADLLKLRNIGAGSAAAIKYLAIVAIVAEAFAAWYCAFQCDDAAEEECPC